MHRLSQVGICTPVKPSCFAHLQMALRSLNGALSPINWARNIPGPLIVCIAVDLIFAENSSYYFINLGQNSFIMEPECGCPLNNTCDAPWPLLFHSYSFV